MNIKNVSCSVIAFLLLTVGTSCSPVNVKRPVSPSPPETIHSFLTPVTVLPQLPASDGYQDIVFSPDNKTLAISTDETRPGYENKYDDPLAYIGRLRLRDLQTGKRILTELSKDDVEAFCFSPDGQHIATELQEGLSTEKSKMQFWDIRSGKLLWSKSINAGQQLIQFSPDGNYIVSAEYSVFIWQAKTGKILHNLYLYVSEGEGVDAMKFSPKGDLVAIDLGERILSLDAKSWRIDPRNALKGGVNLTRSLAFSPDGKLLAVSLFYSEAGISSLWVWDVTKRKLLRSYTDDDWSVVPYAGRPLYFTADGKLLLIDLYTLAVNKPHSKFQPIFKSDRELMDLSIKRMLAVTKSPDGNWVEIWDVKHKILKQKWKSSFPGFPNYDRAVFCPDGSMLATIRKVNDNGREVAQLWHVQ